MNGGNFKKSGQFLLIFLAIIVSVWAGLWGIYFYEQWWGRWGVDQLAKGLKRAEEESYQKAMADTYGGRTPQETLKMYIRAVEKGDYELASRYFIEENRQQELESSNRFNKDKLQNYIKTIKDVLSKFDTEGRYDADKSYFSIYEPILVRMVLYPNNVWKIIEI